MKRWHEPPAACALCALLATATAAPNADAQSLLSLRAPASVETLVAARPDREAPARATQTGAPPPVAQERWSVEIHAGALGGTSGGGGTAALPPPGQAFTTQTLRPSRHVPSWYFGDGAAFYNELPAALRDNHVMVPLDPALHALATRRTGGSVGGRVGFALGNRIRVEVSVDYAAGTLSFDDDVSLRVEESRASFTEGMQAVLRFLNGPSVSAEASVQNDRGAQAITAGELVLDIGRRGRLRPFAAAGGGWAAGFGGPVITLTGQYSFTSPTLNQFFSETDVVRVRYTTGTAGFMTAGGGITYDVTRRSGIRVDVRAQTGPDPRRTTVDTAPSFVSSVTPSWVATATTPALQFANNGLPGAPIRSTLRGETMNDFVTFEAAGWATRVGVTAGWFVRF